MNLLTSSSSGSGSGSGSGSSSALQPPMLSAITDPCRVQVTVSLVTVKSGEVVLILCLLYDELMFNKCT